MNKNSLAHTRWECKYHLVFAPKYRRQIVYGKIRADVASKLYAEGALIAPSRKKHYSPIYIRKSIGGDYGFYK